MIKIPLVIIVFISTISGYIYFQNVQKQQAYSVSNKMPTATPPTQSLTAIIVMEANSFNPQTLTVQKGTKIIFKNEDTRVRWPAAGKHPTHDDYPELDPQMGIKPGDQWSFVIDRVGKWQIHDHLIPSLEGKINVVAGANSN